MAEDSRPTRVPVDIYESAVVAARVNARTVAQQIEHWVRLGRALEMSPQVSYRDIASTLAGHTPYDSLSTPEQAVARQEWAQQIAERTAELDFAEEFGIAGAPHSELDGKGNVVIRHPGQYRAP